MGVSLLLFFFFFAENLENSGRTKIERRVDRERERISELTLKLV